MDDLVYPLYLTLTLYIHLYPVIRLKFTFILSSFKLDGVVHSYESYLICGLVGNDFGLCNCGGNDDSGNVNNCLLLNGNVDINFERKNCSNCISALFNSSSLNSSPKLLSLSIDVACCCARNTCCIIADISLDAGSILSEPPPPLPPPTLISCGRISCKSLTILSSGVATCVNTDNAERNNGYEPRPQ
ncbi:hypothetical protein DERP_014627 [Dermatophagoides pteronyssinus]|uniref:Uncharacterized protein n=1 Tax=Dermatophagoides pteronyssinus TaxID=6956 RepID=A0ABQ8IVX5_DERPT|nr:hypothetical protein DERP_014627 [Dermatophagoides pteronyssinus]